MNANTHYDYFSLRGGNSLTSGHYSFSGHPEVPEAQQHIRAFWNFTGHSKALAEGSQKVNEMLKQVQHDRNTFPRPLGRGIKREGQGCDKTVSEAHRKFLVPYCLSNLVSSKKAAFTLAEVLITLGIIGIVAAMTIPTLISKFQEKSLESQFKKTYSLLNQALQLTNYENGVEYKCYSKTKDFENSDYYEYSQCKEFQEAFFKNLKYLKYDVVNQTTVDYKTKEEVLAEGGGITNPSCSFKYLVADTYKYYLPDGSIVYANPRNSDTGGIFMIVDITGDKGPNKWGYDVFQLSPTKRKNGSVRINEAICAIWEKGGKRTQNILNNIDEVSDDWFAD